MNTSDMNTGDINTADTSPPPPPPPPPPGVPPANPMRRLRKSRTDRVISGVCGGLGEATGVDPVVYRVLLFVLAFFGGAGLLVYAACWLLMPDSGKDASPAEEAINRRVRDRSRRSRMVLALVLGFAALVALGAVSHNNLGALLAVLFAVAVFLLTRRQEAVPAAAPGPAAPDAPDAPAPTTPYGWDLTKPATAGAPPAPAPAPVPPPAPRERSVLGMLTFALALVGVGVLAAADVSGASVPYSAYPALVLAFCGLGLLVGTRFGRARGLIALGIVATLAVPAAALADLVDGDWAGHERYIRPVDVAGLAPSYDYGAGRVQLDLRGVDFSGVDATTEVDLGAGELVVLVPPRVDLHVEVDLGVGRADVLGDGNGGLGVAKDVTDDGPDGPGGGRLHLKLDQGVGHVEVRREAA